MSDLFVGSMIAGCRLEAIAGRGGMGVVYRATQLALDRTVALKAIAPQHAADVGFRERFQRESHIAASIEHPNVIPVYEAGELDGTLYLIMRWVEGTDLRTLVRRSGRLDAIRAVRLLRPVASALAAAHRRGLVHRDVKPANVLIARAQDGEDEHVYLTDFGIARRTDTRTGMTRTGVLVGTVDYTAPERIQGGRGTPASDIYAFGCTLFETLTGHVPFDRPAELPKMWAHLNDPVPSVRAEAPNVPGQLDRVAAKAMAKRPDERYATAAELAAALGGVLADIDAPRSRAVEEPTKITPPEPPATAVSAPSAPATPVPAPAAPPDRPARRSRTPALAAALVVAAAVVIAVVALGGGGSGGKPSRPATSGGLTVGHTVDLGAQPAAIAADLTGNIWISQPKDGEVDRVDSATGKLERLHVGGSPKLLASVARGVWVSGAGSATLERLDVDRGSGPVSTARLSSPPVALAANRDGSVWAAEPDGSIAQFDATGRRDPVSARVKPAPGAMAVGEGWLWAVDGVPLTRIGTGGSHPVRQFSAVPNPLAVTFNTGVWTANADGHVSRFDPRPRFLKVRADHAVADGLNAIAAVDGGGFVWTSSASTKAVYRFEAGGDGSPTAHAVFAAAPIGLAVVGRAAWVATKDGRLTQIRP
jgi:streptogramin lyase